MIGVLCVLWALVLTGTLAPVSAATAVTSAPTSSRLASSQSASPRSASLGSAGSGPASRGSTRPGATSPAARIQLDEQSTTVIRSGNSWTISGTVVNTSTESLERPTVDVAAGSRLLDTAAALDGWLGGRASYATAPMGSEQLDTLPGGGRASFTVSVPADRLSLDYGLGAVPLTVTLNSAGRPRADLRTTVVWQSQDSVPAPVQLSWIVPLTLPADPDLLGPSGAARDAAWRAAIGPGSRVDGLLTQLSGLPVTWVVDPALVRPPAAADPDLPALGGAPAPTASPTA